MNLTSILLMLWAGSGAAYSKGDRETNKQLIARFYQEIYQQWQMDSVDAYLSADFVSHDWPAGMVGPEGFKAYYDVFLTAVPDAHYEVLDLVAENDRVVVRWQMTGTHMGEFPGIDVQPTGRPITLNGVAIYRIENNLMAERWVVSDLYSAIQEVKQVQLHTDTSITYIHNRPASFKSKALQSLMGMMGAKNRLEKELTDSKTFSVPAELPKSLLDKFVVRVDEIKQRKVWTIAPEKHVSQNLVLYIHGGGYVSNLTKYDWQLIEALLNRTNATIVVPDYPLAPTSNYEDVYDYFDGLYRSLVSKSPDKNIVFMGNSAGGGLALGFAQQLRNENQTLRQPSQLILISPWLDITLRNPDIHLVEKKDKRLSIKGLQMAAKAYAGSVDGKDFRVSPIYGDLSGLGKISLFIGTNDLLVADARKLKGLLDDLHIPFNYFEYPEMFHVWVAVTGLKEAQHAIEQIAMLINEDYSIAYFNSSFKAIL